MKAIVDKTGRIQLPDVIRKQLGLELGDEVLLEEQNGQWLIKPADKPQGLAWEGNVLVHHGRQSDSIDDTLAELREERNAQLTEGLPR